MDKDKTPPDLSAIDQSYSPFPSFEQWKELKVDLPRWDENLKRMDAFKAKDPAMLTKARDVAKRAAAIDTGAIEGLYSIDDGFTLTVATQVGFWQNAFRAKEERTRNLIEAQLTGYDEVIDLATKGAPMAEAWVRALHKTLCGAQKTYTVLTDQGEQQHELPLGIYKTHPNHVQTRDGKIHAYAPVLQTTGEMTRLLSELTSPSFNSAHPVIQAAFAHYALVWIHPFADGNGRTARALASVFMYRNASIPFMVLLEHKTDYLAALRAADSDNLQAYVDFALRRAVDSFQLVAESLRAARFITPAQGIDQARRLHVTRGGYVHADIDRAGIVLLASIRQKAIEFAKNIGNTAIRLSVDDHRSDFPNPTVAGQRKPADMNISTIALRFDSAPPAQAQVVVIFFFTVPVDAGPDDELILFTHSGGVDERTSFSMTSLMPTQTTVAQLKLTMFLEAVYGASLETLERKGRVALKASGFAG